jgi:thioredoxin reductase
MSGAIDVAIVGGGPAGLAAATGLAERGISVTVVEREREAGGVPRHADHQGFGIRDLHRVERGPVYARHWVERAAAAGAEIRTSTQATGWAAAGGLVLTAPSGPGLLEAKAYVLASGCRERPRAARWVPGGRPAGVMTTGTLQQAVYLEGTRFDGARAVVVGAEHVAFSALETLRHAGARAVAMTTELPAHQSLAAFRLGAAARFGVSPRVRTAVVAVDGRQRVEGVELLGLADGRREVVACDMIVFTGDWIPDHELAVSGGAPLAPGTRGPRVDAALRTARPGLFAIGNVLQGAETADIASLSGSHVVDGVIDYLENGTWPAVTLPIECGAPLSWISPNAVAVGGASGAPPRGSFLLRAERELIGARILVRQGSRTLASEKVRRVGPGRSTRIASDWTDRVTAQDGTITVHVEGGRRRRAWRT